MKTDQAILYGVDLSQIDKIEKRACDRLAVLGFSADEPLPKTDDIGAEHRLLWLSVAFVRKVREAVAAGRFAEAGEWMQRARSNVDSATFIDLAAERQRRREGQETVSIERIISALESEPTQAAAAAKLNIDERTIRNRVSPEQRAAIRKKKRKR